MFAYKNYVLKKKDSILEQRNVVAAKNLNWNKVHLKVKSNSILITNVNVIRLTESDSTGINDDKGSGQNKDQFVAPLKKNTKKSLVSAN